MVRWTPPQSTTQKRDVLDALADDFLHNYGRGRTLFAVDGLAGSGTAGFADALAERMGRGGHAVFRASIDDFHQPRAKRELHPTAEGYYRDAFDYALFRRVLIQPFKLAGSTAWVPAAWDEARDVQVEPRWTTGPEDATLIVDGVFLDRPELRGLWNFSTWLEVPAALAAERRGAAKNAPEVKAEKLYLKGAKPKDRATAIIDNSDIEHPRRLFADSC